MNRLTILALVTFLALFLLVPAVSATPALDSPPPDADPVGDITGGFENLPEYFGLGAVVALIVMVARFAGLPDGVGGKAGLAVGVFAYVAAKLLPPDVRDQLFEALARLAEFLLVVIGSQLTHRGAKYAGLSWWKSRDKAD